MEEKKPKKTVCKECNKEFWRITNSHLKRCHNMSMKDYLNKYPNSLFEDPLISYERQNHKREKSYDEIYGEKRAKELKNQKSIVTFNDWKNKNKYKDIKIKTLQHKKNREKKIIEFKSMIAFRKFWNLQSYNKYWCKNCKKKLVYNIYLDKPDFCSNECEEDFKLSQTINNYVKHNSLVKNKPIKTLYNYDYILEEKEHICERCGKDLSKERVCIHHIDENHLNNESNNLMLLCMSCHTKLHSELDKLNNKFIGNKWIKQGVSLILKGLRIDIKDKNFLNTPNRVARAYEEIFEGLYMMDEIRDLLSTTFPTEYEGIVQVSNIWVYSMCPHHLLPVTYNIAVSYISNKKGLGLSKIPRLVELLAKRPILQETLTSDIVNIINDTIEPLGVACIVKGKHLCMHMRGVKKPESWVTTSLMKGLFLDNPRTRSEFLEFCKKN